jgi:hypothetical protein
MSLKRITFIISIVVAIYFTAFFTLNMIYDDQKPPVIIGVFVELLTIPMLLAAPVFLIISLVQFIKEGFTLKSTYLYSFVLLLIVTTFLVVMTIRDAKVNEVQNVQVSDTTNAQ